MRLIALFITLSPVAAFVVSRPVILVSRSPPRQINQQRSSSAADDADLEAMSETWEDLKKKEKQVEKTGDEVS